MSNNEYFKTIQKIDKLMLAYNQYLKTAEENLNKAIEEISNEYNNNCETLQIKHNEEITKSKENCEQNCKNENNECYARYSQYLLKVSSKYQINCYDDTPTNIIIPKICIEMGNIETKTPNKYKSITFMGRLLKNQYAFAYHQLDKLIKLYELDSIFKSKHRLAQKCIQIIKFEESYYKKRIQFHNQVHIKQVKNLINLLEIDLEKLEKDKESKIELKRNEHQLSINNEYSRVIASINSKFQEIKKIQKLANDNIPKYYFSDFIYSEWKSFVPMNEDSTKRFPLGFSVTNYYHEKFIFPIKQHLTTLVQQIVQEGFNSNFYRFRIPCLLAGSTSMKLFIGHDEEQKKNIIESVQFMILKIARESLSGYLKVTVIDTEGRGSNIGILQELSEKNNCPLIKNISDEDGALSAIKSIVKDIDNISSKSNISDLINTNKNQHLLVIFDYQELAKNTTFIFNLKVILNKAAECGISVIIISQEVEIKVDEMFQTEIIKPPSYEKFTDFVVAKGSSILWKETPNESDLSYTIELQNTSIVANDFITQMREYYCTQIDNSFERFYNLSNLPPNKDSSKFITIPIAIDSDNEIVNFELGGSSSAHAMITGSTGSGKSTLLHTIISGILLNYSHEDVELWLADYKKVEFAQYIENNSPHIKVIVLEKSYDFTYSLIRELEKICKEREELFVKAGVIELEEYNKSPEREKGNLPYLPRIVVMIDEFHNLSDALLADEDYKMRFNNMLREYRSFGFSFIFSDQLCSRGIKGLADEGKEQISVRIAMRNNNQSEIYETLITTASNIDEGIKDRMNNFTIGDLILRRSSAQGVKMIWAKGMNIDRRKDIPNICNHLKNSLLTSIEPPRVVDGRKRFHADELIINKHLEEQKNIGNIKPRNIPIVCGTPMSLEKCLHFNFDKKDNQHILLVSGIDELKMSIIYHTINSFIRAGNNRVIVIGNEEEIIFSDYERAWKNLESIGLERYISLPDICKCIKSLYEGLYTPRSEATQKGSTLLIGLGLDSVFTEIKQLSRFPLPNNSEQETKEDSSNVVWNMGGYGGVSDVEESIKAEIPKKLTRDTITFGKSTEEKRSTVAVADSNNTHIYDASNDFAQLAEYGGKKGVHLVLVLDDFNHLRKRYDGLNIDYFNHRIGTKMSDTYTSDFFGKRIVIDEKEKNNVACYSSGDGGGVKMFRPFLFS